MLIKKRYPMSGQKQWETTSMVISRAFRIDAGVQASGTATTEMFDRGSIILGFRAKVTEAFTSGGSATVQLGFASNLMISAAVAVATLVANYPVGGQQTNGSEACPYVLTASDTFDCIVGAATLTAGKFDVDVYHVPPRNGVLGDEFEEFVTA